MGIGRTILSAAIAVIAMVAAPIAATAEPLKVRIGWANMPHHLIPVLYSKRDILKHYGKSYTVEHVQFRGSSPQLAALAAGEIDLTVTSALAFVLAVNNAGVDMRVVADVIQDVPGHRSTGIYVKKTSGIKTVGDLRGKRIATNTIGSFTDSVMRAMLDKHGLRDKVDFTMIEASFANIHTMLEEGKVDAGPVINPWGKVLRESGRYDIVFTQMDAIGGANAGTFLAGRQAFLEKNRAALMDFFEDHVRAMRWFQDPKNRQEAIGIISSFMRQSPERLSYIFSADDYYRDPFAMPNAANMQVVVDLVHRLRLAPVRLELFPKYIDSTFTGEAKRRIEAGK